MARIIDRTGKGSALSAAEYDSALDILHGINEPQTGATHTIDVNDQGKTIEYSRATAIAVTLPAISTVSGSNIDTSDFQVTLKNIGAGVVTATCGGADTFDDGSTAITLSQYESVTLQTDNSLGKWNILNKSHTSADLNLLDVATVGTVEASKVVTVDANRAVSNMGNIGIVNAVPILDLNESDATADNKLWRMAVENEVLNFEVVNDAVSVSTPWCQVNRTGTTVDSVGFGAKLTAITADADLNFERNGTGDITVDTTETVLTDASSINGSQLVNTSVSGDKLQTSFTNVVNGAAAGSGTTAVTTTGYIRVVATGAVGVTGTVQILVNGIWSNAHQASVNSNYAWSGISNGSNVRISMSGGAGTYSVDQLD